MLRADPHMQVRALAPGCFPPTINTATALGLCVQDAATFARKVLIRRTEAVALVLPYLPLASLVSLPRPQAVL